MKSDLESLNILKPDLNALKIDLKPLKHFISLNP